MISFQITHPPADNCGLCLEKKLQDGDTWMGHYRLYGKTQNQDLEHIFHRSCLKRAYRQDSIKKECFICHHEVDLASLFDSKEVERLKNSDLYTQSAADKTNHRIKLLTAIILSVNAFKNVCTPFTATHPLCMSMLEISIIYCISNYTFAFENRPALTLADVPYTLLFSMAHNFTNYYNPISIESRYLHQAIYTTALLALNCALQPYEEVNVQQRQRPTLRLRHKKVYCSIFFLFAAIYLPHLNKTWLQ